MQHGAQTGSDGISVSRQQQPIVVAGSPIPQPSTTGPASRPGYTFVSRSAAASNGTGTSTGIQRAVCPVCDSTDLLEDAHEGITVCRNCGRVLGSIIDTGSEWRTFQDDGSSRGGVDMNRVGGVENALLQDLGLSTVIGRNADGSHSAMARLHHHGTLDSRHRYLLDGFGRVSRLVGELQLPRSIEERAKEIFKKCYDSKEFKSKNADIIVVACIYIGCRQEGIARSLKEVCASGNVTTAQVGKVTLRIKELKLHKNLLVDSAQQNDVPEAANAAANQDSMVERFCSLLTLSPDVIRAAQHVVRRANALNLTQGRSVAVTAGAAIYMITQLRPDQRRNVEQVAQVVHMAAMTVRNMYSILYTRRSELVPTDFASTRAVNALSTTVS